MRFVPALAKLALAGAAVALVVGLAASFGTRAGLWDWRTGLFVLLPWCVYVAAGALALALLWAAVTVVRKPQQDSRIGLAAVVASAAVLAVPLYYGWRAHNSPPIHDISSDIATPPQFRAVLPLRAGAENSPVYDGQKEVAWNGKTRTVGQWQRKYYTDIFTHRILTPPAKLYARALAAAKDMGWTIVSESANEGRIEATDTTLFFGFTDDIVIRVRPSGMGAKIDIRSESRVGKSDGGRNAARIRAYIKTLADTHV